MFLLIRESQDCPLVSADLGHPVAALSLQVYG